MAEILIYDPPVYAHEYGQAQGPLQLDSSGLIPVGKFPATFRSDAHSGLHYRGGWDAAGSPPRPSRAGDYFIVTAPGTTPLAGHRQWGVGDWAVCRAYDPAAGATAWDLIPNSGGLEIAALQGQVAALQGQVAALQGQVDTLQLEANILPANSGVLKGSLGAGATVTAREDRPSLEVYEGSIEATYYIRERAGSTLTGAEVRASRGVTLNIYYGETLITSGDGSRPLQLAAAPPRPLRAVATLGATPDGASAYLGDIVLTWG
jgi:hypothetical protein